MDPFRQRQAVEPTHFPYLRLIMLPTAVLCWYSLLSGALGQQPGHWWGTHLLLLQLVFLFQSLFPSSFCPWTKQ